MSDLDDQNANSVSQSNDLLVQDSSHGMGSSQDPIMEDFLLGMVPREQGFNNPFQVAEGLRNEMVRQAEQSGRRAIEWNLSSFDRVGGENTLRRVWASLKSQNRISGVKRRAEDNTDTSSDERASSPKKLRVSLNVSSACERLNSILLQ